MAGDRRQPHRCDTATRLAIRISAKLARRNGSFEVGGDRLRCQRKYAIFRALWRSGKLPDETFRHIELRISLAKLGHVGNGLRTLVRRKHFRKIVANLRGEKAEPHLSDLLLWRPEGQEFIQISGALHHLSSDRAVDGDAAAGYVGQYTLVGCRCSSHVMFRLQSVDRHDHIHVRLPAPLLRESAERASDDLDMDTAAE